MDWNVFARTERCYLKRYRGETNTQLLILLDTSASMGYGSHAVNKLDYARFWRHRCATWRSEQRDAAGLIVFDDDVQNYVAPSTRQGQLFRLLHAIEKAEPGTRTDFAKPFVHFQQFLHRRGMVVVISDFYEEPETIVKTVEPLRFRGNEVILFHVLDPQEIGPSSASRCCWSTWRRRARSKSRRNTRSNEYRAQDRRAHRGPAHERAPRPASIIS